MKGNKVNNLLIAVVSSLAVSGAVANLARAEGAKPDNELSYNAAVTSDFRFRGISQSRLQPASHSGADYTHNPIGL